MQSTGLMVFWLLIVLALIPVSLWLLKRSGMATGLQGEGAAAVLKPVAQVSLGNGQRVVTIEVNSGEQRTWLVLGVTGQQINTLHTMDAPAAQPGANNVRPLPPFAQLLRRVADRQGASSSATGSPQDPRA
ncbi:flagellar biogenesis protein [Aquabacterium soli]|jgi:flagellar protein FliO/FliZ|uniref:Flagellar biogenesis protein n=1 Tax=Aquabacterium soli TaxID=2493092 RepID=A0A426VFN1_9BURK|nr:flagellar biosynthetic protein FliO [Aquabacterium soli]RRS05733.1 flagellar biogenesis protein [Aquabacterium soli]